MLYDLNKKGTVIITIGRSGSHLLGDIISNQLTNNKIAHYSLLENLMNYSLNFETVNDFYKNTLAEMSNNPNYIISQIQDFNSKVWLLSNYSNKWLNDYHVVILKRTNKVAHFFSKQILENFNSTIPVHTIKGFNYGDFSSLKNQTHTVDIDSVWQFLSEQQILNRFDGNQTVIYEDMITWPEVDQSKYLKNNYNVNFKDLFTNYTDVVSMLEYHDK